MGLCCEGYFAWGVLWRGSQFFGVAESRLSPSFAWWCGGGESENRGRIGDEGKSFANPLIMRIERRGAKA